MQRPDIIGELNDGDRVQPTIAHPGNEPPHVTPVGGNGVARKVALATQVAEIILTQRRGRLTAFGRRASFSKLLKFGCPLGQVFFNAIVGVAAVDSARVVADFGIVRSELATMPHFRRLSRFDWLPAFPGRTGHLFFSVRSTRRMRGRGLDDVFSCC